MRKLIDSILELGFSLVVLYLLISVCTLQTKVESLEKEVAVIKLEMGAKEIISGTATTSPTR